MMIFVLPPNYDDDEYYMIVKLVIVMILMTRTRRMRRMRVFYKKSIERYIPIAPMKLTARNFLGPHLIPTRIPMTMTTTMMMVVI